MSKKYKYQNRPRAQRKANPQLAGMTVIDGMTQPRSMPRNYKAYAREGYGQNDTLFKVCNYAMINGAAIPPVLFKDKSMKNGRIEQHALLERLDMPNPEMTGVFFRKAVIGYYLISGNSFLYAIRTNKAGPPDELWLLPPDRVRPVPDEKRGIVGYEYEDWSKDKNPIPPQLVGHLRTWNPEDPFFGMSWVQVVALMIDQQTDARKWNLSLFQNHLKPPGAWTTTALLSPNERSKLEARINEKMAGFRNAGKTPVLDGALKFESSAVAPSEMDWIESMKFNSGAIANVYNMPPQLIGDTSSTTYDNYEQAEVVSYTEFIFPVLDDFYGLLNHWLVPMYPDLAKSGAYLYYDKETVEVVQKILQAQKDAQADRATKLWMSGVIMQNEARQAAGYEEVPDGNVYRIGGILVPAGKMEEYAAQALTTPAMPLPEPLDKPEPAPALPEPKVPEKSRKWQEPTNAWSPEDYDERLDAYKAEGVTHLIWRVSSDPCQECLGNDGVKVVLGELFPSGAIIPPQHPNCMCWVDAYAGEVRKSLDLTNLKATRDPKQQEDLRRARREGYRRFMEATLV